VTLPDAAPPLTSWAASTRLWWATREVGLLLVVTAATWLWTVVRSGSLQAMPGAMGLTLPAVVPVASLYARSVERQRRADSSAAQRKRRA